MSCSRILFSLFDTSLEVKLVSVGLEASLGLQSRGVAALCSLLEGPFTAQAGCYDSRVGTLSHNRIFSSLYLC